MMSQISPSSSNQQSSQNLVHPEILAPIKSTMAANDDTLEKRPLEKVYIDGSALHNGFTQARAGIGVYWNDGDNRNLSEPLEGKLQTNQRAELMSAIRALEIMGNDPTKREIEICTDSKYLIHSMTLWRFQWRKNQWKDTLGKQLKNIDLLQHLDAFCDRYNIIWTYVPGHKGIYGNEMANLLAQKAASNKLPRN